MCGLFVCCLFVYLFTFVVVVKRWDWNYILSVAVDQDLKLFLVAQKFKRRPNITRYNTICISLCKR